MADGEGTLPDPKQTLRHTSMKKDGQLNNQQLHSTWHTKLLQLQLNKSTHTHNAHVQLRTLGMRVCLWVKDANIMLMLSINPWSFLHTCKCSFQHCAEDYGNHVYVCVIELDFRYYKSLLSSSYKNFWMKHCPSASMANCILLCFVSEKVRAVHVDQKLQQYVFFLHRLWFICTK